MLLLLVIALFGLLHDGSLASTCNEDSFPCDDGSCIYKLLWCDAEPDCSDHSDERYCFLSTSLRPNPNNCNDTFFVCKDGPCIPIVGRCDGYHSCRDGSDEEGCKYRRSRTEANFSTSSLPYLGTKVITTTESGTELTSLLYFNSTMKSVEPATFKESSTVELTPVDSTTQGLTTVDSKNDIVDLVLSDSGSTGKHKNEDIEKGFKDIDLYHFKRQISQAQLWLLNIRDQNFGWGDETPRALVALYTSDFFSEPQDEMLMSKQLHVQILAALTRNRTAPIALWELSLFINALSATCDNPKNFHGQNLVEILRQRADKANVTSKFISPLVFLTLCLNDATTHDDLDKLLQILKYTSKIDKIDNQALVSLSATCISRIPKFASSHKFLKDMSTRLYSKVVQQGLPESIYKLSLVAQALNEARINQNKWNRSEALQLISDHQDDNGSFADILSAYYTMPLLSGGSLLSIGRRCNFNTYKDFTPMEILKNGDGEKIWIRYSLDFGDPVQVSQTIRLKVKNNTSLLDIMRIAADINSVYKFRYDMTDGKPEVYSIGGMVNDPESGLYWKLHETSVNEANKTLTPYEGDIRTFKPEDGATIVFWLKSLY